MDIKECLNVGEPIIKLYFLESYKRNKFVLEKIIVNEKWEIIPIGNSQESFVRTLISLPKMPKEN